MKNNSGKYGAANAGIIHFHDDTPDTTLMRGGSTEDYGLPSGESSIFNSIRTQSESIMKLPNIGESNAAIGEDSLRESLRKMRLINIIACLLVLIFEIPNFLGNVFTLKPAKVVLGIYLTLFAILLCAYELDIFLSKQIERYFGILHHPIGRSVIIFMMGGLAIGQGGMYLLLGFLFIGSAAYTALTYIWYPEYRRRTEERLDLYEETPEVVNISNLWARPSGETSSLLKAGESLSFFQKVVLNK